MRYTFQIHAEDSMYWGECRELPGCVSQGPTPEALKINLTEALNLYLEESSDSSVYGSLPDKEGRLDSGFVSILVEPEIAFGVLLRAARKAAKLTQKQAAGRLGMKNLYSYQRLERRSNPTLLLLEKIKQVFPQISLDQLVETSSS